MLVSGALCDIKTQIEYFPLARFKNRRLFSYASLSIACTWAHFKYVRAHVEPLVKHLSKDYQKRLVNRFSELFEQHDFNKAYKDLSTIVKPVTKVLNLCPFDDLDLLKSEDKREKLANKLSRHCIKQVDMFGDTATRLDLPYEESVVQAYQLICELTKPFKIPPKYNPEKATIEQSESGLLRFFDLDCWLEHFETITKRTNEHIAIALGYVGKNISPYVSRNALAEFKRKQKANLLYLSQMDAVNTETQERFNLLDLVKASSANPEKRRIELMVRCRGLEEMAKKEGKDAIFLTMTAPSKYHKNSKKWLGNDPKFAHEYLCKTWQKQRAELARHNIDYMGVRVVEPHADATPHWHLLLFVKPEQRRLLVCICRQYATNEDKQELIKGHKKHIQLVRLRRAKTFRPHWYTPRFTCELIDPDKGSATGYIAKYISKNINGSNMEGQLDDEAEIDINESANRVTAWASLWGIRQFQFFGAASVTVWRECRRIKSALDCSKMELVRQAADKGCWQEFSEHMQTHRLNIAYEDKGDVNTYNEKILRIKGIELAQELEVTRVESFDLQRRVAASWSPVTNCTEVQKQLEKDWTLSDKGKNKLFKLGFDEGSLDFLMSGNAVFIKGQKFEIINNQLRAH